MYILCCKAAISRHELECSACKRLNPPKQEANNLDVLVYSRRHPRSSDCTLLSSASSNNSRASSSVNSSYSSSSSSNSGASSAKAAGRPPKPLPLPPPPPQPLKPPAPPPPPAPVELRCGSQKTYLSMARPIFGWYERVQEGRQIKPPDPRPIRETCLTACMHREQYILETTNPRLCTQCGCKSL